MHLTAARHLLERVTTADIIKAMGLTMEEVDDYMFTDVNFWAGQLADHGIVSVSPQKVMLDARNFRELESLVRVLDNLETIGSLVELSAEYDSLEVSVIEANVIMLTTDAGRRPAIANTGRRWGQK
jgi:nuclear pore complex protein Nup107